MVSFTMPAAEAALNGPREVVDEMVAEFDKRRKHTVERLNAIEGITCAMPGGAFYVFPNVSALYGRKYDGKLIDGSDAFSNVMLECANVLVIAGSGFGADNYVRLSYATSMECIDKGIDRIAEAVAKLD
jgi:aspartate aminotransferase